METPKPSCDPLVHVMQPSRDLIPAARGKGLRRPAVLCSTPDVIGVLKALRRCWPLAVTLGLLLAATAGPLAWFLLPRPTYTASSTIFVAMVPKRIVFESSEGHGDPRAYQHTQAAMIRNRFILSHALSKPEIAGLETIKELVKANGDPEEWLESKIMAEFPGASEVLEVALTGERPEDLAKIVNSVVGSYKSLVVDEEQKERMKRLEELQTLWDRYQKELKVKRQSLETLAAEIGSDNKDELTINRQFKGAQLGLVQSELMRVQTDLLRAQAEMKVIEESPTSAPALSDSGGGLDTHVERHPHVAELRGRLEELRRKYSDVDRVTRVKR